MAGFGRFETLEDLASTGPFTLYSARPAGKDGPPAFAIKTFRTFDDFADADVLQAQAAAFLEGARVQQALAQAGPGWAPVHDLGQTESHAYYITDLYDTTCQRLVDSRRELSGRAISDVLTGVADALALLHATRHGRGHGALRPGNVLLRPRDPASGEIEGSKVFLADPLPDAKATGNANADDLRELGGLLHQLVLHRPPARGAVPSAPEWAALGQQGEQLRQLCDQLLSPQPGAAILTPADIKSKLAGVLKARGKVKEGPSKVVIALVVVVVLAAIGGGAVLLLKGNGGGGGRKDRVTDAWMIADLERSKQALTEVVARIKASGTPDQLRAAETLDKQLIANDEAVVKVRGMPWPGPDEPNSLDRKRDKDQRADAVEKQIVMTQANIDALSVLVPTVPLGGDPRSTNPSTWYGAGEQLLIDSKEEAEKILREERDSGAGPLQEVLGSYATLSGRIAEIRALSWEPASPEGTPSVEALGATRTAQDNIRTMVAEVQKDADAFKAAMQKARNASGERRTAYLDDLRQKRDSVVASNKLREAYVNGIIALQSRNAGWAQVHAEADRLTAWVRGIDAEFPREIGVETPANSKVDVAGAEVLVAEEREAAVGNAVNASDAAARSRISGEFKSQTEQSRALLADALKLEEMLASGFGYEDAGPDGSIKSLRGKIEGSPRFARLESSVAGVAASANALEEVDNLSDAPSLRARLTAAEGGGPASVGAVSTAWRKLAAADFPTTPEELSAASALYTGTVKPVLEQAPATLKDAFLKAAADVRPGMWSRYAETHAGPTRRGVDAAFKAMPEFGVTPEQLKPWVRFNYERWLLLNEAEKLPAPVDAKEQAQKVGEFLAAFWKHLETTPANGVAKTSVDALRTRLKSAESATDLEKEGPARPREGAAPSQWVGKIPDGDDEGRTVTYSWKGPKSGVDHRLEFIRVGPEEAPSYVAATEVSVGLFMDLLPDNRVNDVKSMNKDRMGPRAWEWDDANRQSKVQLAKPPQQPGKPHDPSGNGWLSFVASARMDEIGCYRPGTNVPPPTMFSPMSDVPVGAAVIVAQTVKCRLPTVKEWQEASKRVGGSPNRRDQLWADQHAYVMSINERASGDARFPNDEIFRPVAEQAGVREADNKPAVEGSDGWLWFRPVHEQSGAGFRDVIGNVAEWVCENAGPLDTLTQTTIADIDQALGRKGENVFVIGGSALSPPEYEPGSALKAPTFSRNRSYSDVGFRLAFSAGAGGGSGKPVERLKKILGGDDFLTAASN